MADQGIWKGLRDSSAVVTDQPGNDTKCYSVLIYLVRLSDGKTIGSIYAQTGAGVRSNNIVTAYPADNHCTGSRCPDIVDAMGFQEQLTSMLRFSYPVERVNAEDFLIRPNESEAIRLHAPESELSLYSQIHAEDGLQALGDINDDRSGATSALALLSVLIAEEIASSIDASVRQFSVLASGLITERNPTESNPG